VSYEGSNFEGEGATAPPCEYALALVDEAAGTVSFVPLAGGRVLRLDAKVAGVDYGPPAWTADGEEDTPAGRAAARRRLDDCASPSRRRSPLRTLFSILRLALTGRPAQRSRRRSGGARRRGCRRSAPWLRRRCLPSTT